MRIVYTKHAKKKFKDLEKLGVIVKRKLVNQTITNPLEIDAVSDYPKKIASSKIDRKHILRVVYKEESGIIVIITFYPTKKGRYKI